MNKKKMIMSTMLVLTVAFGGLVGCSNQTTTNPTTQNVKKKVTLGKKTKNEEKADETESSIESKSEIASTETGKANASSNNNSTSTSSKTNLTASTSSNSNKNNNSNSSNSSSSQHTHNWVAQTKTVHHDEVGHYEQVLIKNAYDEQFPEYEQEEHEICNLCGVDFTANGIDPYSHGKQHYLNDGHLGGFHTVAVSVLKEYKTIHHDAEYSSQYVVDKQTYDETITTGYKCSTCGKAK